MMVQVNRKLHKVHAKRFEAIGENITSMKILQLGDPLLEKKSKIVKNIKELGVQNLIKQMLKILNKDVDKTAGLAAPQLGKLLNIIICRRVDLEIDEDDKNVVWEVMINPRITKKSKTKTVAWEGCLSVQNGNIFGEVIRPEKISVVFFDKYGKKKSLNANDYLAHVVQHEIDHLNGILFVKYVQDPDSLLTLDELEQLSKKEAGR